MANPRLIPAGINNPVIMNVAFEIGQADYNVAYIRLTDAQNERYSPPESAVNKPSAKGNMRLDMCGFKLLDKPFGFRFTDTRNSSNVILSTENSALIMMDKYLQMDINLPSRRIYGLGERTTNFSLGEGTWTMWASG